MPDKMSLAICHMESNPVVTPTGHLTRINGWLHCLVGPEQTHKPAKNAAISRASSSGSSAAAK
jgi:hypothetical protein